MADLFHATPASSPQSGIDAALCCCSARHCRRSGRRNRKSRAMSACSRTAPPGGPDRDVEAGPLVLHLTSGVPDRACRSGDT
jgi:hypothetical protein